MADHDPAEGGGARTSSSSESRGTPSASPTYRAERRRAERAARIQGRTAPGRRGLPDAAGQSIGDGLIGRNQSKIVSRPNR